MGLDTIAYNQKTERAMDDSLFKHIPPVLVGGLLSGNGDGPSFRGKVYSDFVEHVTEQTLYQELIENSIVRKMVESFDNFLNEFPEDKTYQKMDLTKEEAVALRDWLKVVADNDGSVMGWW
jgi:hypothetical protein